MAFSPDYRTYSRAPSATDVSALDEGLRAYMLRVYNWMASGLLITGIVAYGIVHSSLFGLFYQPVHTAFGSVVYRQTGLAMISIFAPLAFVLVLSVGVNRLSRPAVQAIYWAFCAAMGASLTNIFLIYTGESVVRTFFVTAGAFAGLSLYGYATRRNLGPVGQFLGMGLFGLVIVMLISAIFGSGGMQPLIDIVGVVIFAGLTAYDTQRIKLSYENYAYAQGPELAAKRSVYDALSLYLNFINLFTFLLQLTGSRNNQ